MSSILRIQFPDDFEKRYGDYKSKLLGSNISIQRPVSSVDHLGKKDGRMESVSMDTVRDDAVPSTKIDGNIGYLLLHSETIEIGESDTGKFKLVETLCDPFGKPKSIDFVFNYTKANKDKNKNDNSLESDFMGYSRKVTLIRSQMREINRAITNYTKTKNLKKFKYRVAIKVDHKFKKTIWLEERLVGRRGE